MVDLAAILAWVTVPIYSLDRDQKETDTVPK